LEGLLKSTLSCFNVYLRALYIDNILFLGVVISHWKLEISGAQMTICLMTN